MDKKKRKRRDCYESKGFLSISFCLFAGDTPLTLPSPPRGERVPEKRIRTGGMAVPLSSMVSCILFGKELL